MELSIAKIDFNLRAKPDGPDSDLVIKYEVAAENIELVSNEKVLKIN